MGHRRMHPDVMEPIRAAGPGKPRRRAAEAGGSLCAFFRDNRDLCQRAFDELGQWASDAAVQQWFRIHGVWRLPADLSSFANVFRDRQGNF